MSTMDVIAARNGSYENVQMEARHKFDVQCNCIAYYCNQNWKYYLNPLEMGNCLHFEQCPNEDVFNRDNKNLCLCALVCSGA